MEFFSSIKLNNVMQNDYCQERHNRIVLDSLPKPECRNLPYIDSRCLAMLGPYTLLGTLPKQITNSKTLKMLVNKNPQLKKMLKENKINLNKADYVNFLNFSDEHMKSCAYIAGKICDGINKNIDKTRVVKAARLHDMGKIFIPAKILNKPNNLSKSEKKIMAIHSELGYQLLRTFNIDAKTLDIIKNHHNFNSKSSLEQQIVSAADIFAALTENRPYKKSMSGEQAINILKLKDFSPEVIQALENMVNDVKLNSYRLAG